MDSKRNKIWDSENIDAAANKAAGEVQLKKYGKCMEEYAIKLEKIEEKLGDCISNSWDMSLDPSGLNSLPAEQASLLQLIDTDNKILNKVLIALAAVCAQIQHVAEEARSKYYNVIIFYGEGSEQDASTSITQLLPTLQNVYCLVMQCERVLQSALKQLNALHSNKSASSHVPRLDVHFQVVVEHIGDLLVIMLTLDELFKNQAEINDNWNAYKRTLKSIVIDPSRGGNKYHQLEQVISDIEQNVLSGNILQRALENLLDGHNNVSPCPGVIAHLCKYIKQCAPEIESELEPDTVWLRLSALFVLYSTLSGSTDKKLFKSVWEPHKKIFSVTLFGNIAWTPEDFFLNHLPHLSQVIDKKVKSQIRSSRLYYLQQKLQNLQKDTQYYYFQVCSWLVQMDTCMKQDSTHLKIGHLQMRCSLFLQGLDYAFSLNRLVKTVMNLHVSLGLPMTKASVIALCRLLELLKCIQYMYHAHTIAVAESINHVIQYLTFQALGIILNAKKTVPTDSKYSATRLDVLSSLLLLERALHGPGTRERRLVAYLAMSTANQMKTFREDDLANLRHLLKKLDVICELQIKLRLACDCSFLYWHRVILPIYFTYLFEGCTEMHRIKYIFAALNDCMRSICSIKLAGLNSGMEKKFEEEMYVAFKKQVVHPLCHQIETDLRLHVHSHLQLDERNPLQGNVDNYMFVLKTPPLRFFGQFISIKSCVENYLNQTFYNLTTVALHDWKTYGEMRCLAIQKYNLRTVEDDLPSQTLEQGLDVLEIMRNIHVFVSKYLYNLNNQIFVEHSSNNKHLNTINIRHIANSIRTHGTGIMNTTVNFTYQFLKKKFYILSQFLYDEHIKSRLIRDIKYFRETKFQTDQKYSFERAEKFNWGIRKLGLSPDKLTYLDQFRILVTHIGNAMGYVRMIRSGGLHCCSNAICFIPDLEDIVSFQELSQEQGFTASYLESAKSLDRVIGTLARNFDEGTEYFKLLVDVFAPVCRDPKNLHLQNFHVIVPPLTINFVEYSITCKDKMTKKNRSGAAFTDDGFAMGIAYILKMLDLNSEFDSLHWFESVKEKYRKEKAKLLEQKSSISKDDEKLQQTMTLTARRLDLYQQEFELLHYSLSSACIFFQKYSQSLQGEKKK